MKAFIVTSGHYSDYHIEAVFSTKEKAEEFINNRGDSDFNDIEEYEMDVHCERQTAIYHCSVNPKSGEISVVSRVDKDNRCSLWKINTFKLSNYLVGTRVHMYIETDTLDKAKKIAAERWQQIRAMKDICFPKMFEKCVLRKRVMLKYAEADYPRYNFITKEIVLEDGETFVEDVEKEKERLKKEGFEILF